MIQSRVKRILRDGGLAIVGQPGTLGGISMVEIIGLAGFDGVFIDMEHTAYDLSDVQTMILTAERVGITPIVRTPGFDPALLLRLLDMGAQGLQIPGIEDADGARAVVDCVRFAPLGNRGMSISSRAAEYGRVPVLDHMEQSNRELTLLIMIEGIRAVQEVEAIASVQGVDVVTVGPADLAKTLGVTGHPDHPDLAATVQRIADTLRDKGKARLGFPIGNKAYPLGVPELQRLGVGYSIFAPPPDVQLLRLMQQQVEQMRALLQGA